MEREIDRRMSSIFRKLKRNQERSKTMSNKKNTIPFQIPGIGGGQQPPFDLSQAEKKSCNACKSELFNKVCRMGLISQFATKNTTKKDIPVEYAVYVCRECGWEFNVEVKEKQ